MQLRHFLCATGLALAQGLALVPSADAAVIAPAAIAAPHSENELTPVRYWHRERVVCHWSRFYHRRVCRPMHRHW